MSRVKKRFSQKGFILYLEYIVLVLVSTQSFSSTNEVQVHPVKVHNFISSNTEVISL